MSTTYAQRQTTAQKKDATTAASVLDTSSQSESLQRKADMANNAAQREEAPRPNNTGMPDNLKSGIESLSGFSMDDVRVHYNSSKPATVQALAYTQGTDIHVAPGQEKHLPHEAWHVAQQMAGRVSPTTNINGMPVNDNAALEHEADVMGEKAVQYKRNDGNVVSKVLQCARNIIQCVRNQVRLVCVANIYYQDPTDGLEKHVKGVGRNNDHDKDRIKNTFCNFGFRDLFVLRAGLDQTPLGIYESNAPGKCAEPHAFAFALKALHDAHPNYKLRSLAKRIKGVYISDSVVLEYNTENEGTVTNESLLGSANPNRPPMRGSKVNTCRRCPTCQQWISPDGNVIHHFLDVEDSLGWQTFSLVPWNALMEARSHDAGDEIEKTPVIAYVPDGSGGRHYGDYGRYKFEYRTMPRPHGSVGTDHVSFNNIDFFTADGRIPEKRDYVSLLNSLMTALGINSDSEISAISHAGLRTVLKKDMLKHRFEELLQWRPHDLQRIKDLIDQIALCEKNYRQATRRAEAARRAEESPAGERDSERQKRRHHHHHRGRSSSSSSSRSRSRSPRPRRSRSRRHH